MANVNVNNMGPEVRAMLAKDAVLEARKSMLYTKFCDEGKLSKRSGDQVTFYSMHSLAPTKTALTTPTHGSYSAMELALTGEIISNKQWTATLAEYGQVAYELRRNLDMRQEDHRKNMILSVGKSMGQSIEMIVSAALLASSGAKQVYANAVAGVANIVSLALAADLNGIAAYFDNKYVEKITDFVSPDSGVGTTAVRPCYVGFVPADCVPDVMALTGFQHSEMYRNQGELLDTEEFGRLGGIRFVRVPNYLVATGAGAANTTVRNTAGNVDVYTIVIAGAHFAGYTPFEPEALKGDIDEDYKSKVIITEGSDKLDPLDRFVAFGWRANVAAVGFTGLTSGERYICYRCAASKQAVTLV